MTAPEMLWAVGLAIAALSALLYSRRAGPGRAIDRVLFSDNPTPMWIYGLQTLRFLDVNDAAILQYGNTDFRAKSF